MASEPQSIAEQLAIDNPRVIAYLKSLGPERKGRPVNGIRLSDGTVELKGALYLGSRFLTSKKQHIYLFRDEGFYSAYVWVEKGGRELAIPPDPAGSSGENASVLSGDIYTFGQVGPGDGLVIFSGASPEWLKKQIDNSAAETDLKLFWEFGKPSKVLPKGNLSLRLNGRSHTVIKKAEAAYQQLKNEEFKDYHIPQTAVLAAFSWHAGFGDVVYVLRKENILEVYRREMDESETSRYPVKKIAGISLD